MNIIKYLCVILILMQSCYSSDVELALALRHSHSTGENIEQISTKELQTLNERKPLLSQPSSRKLSCHKPSCMTGERTMVAGSIVIALMFFAVDIASGYLMLAPYLQERSIERQCTAINGTVYPAGWPASCIFPKDFPCGKNSTAIFGHQYNKLCKESQIGSILFMTTFFSGVIAGCIVLPFVFCLKKCFKDY